MISHNYNDDKQIGKKILDLQTLSYFFLLFFFLVTWDGRFNKRKTNKKLYPIKNEENWTWDGVENGL